MSRFLITGGAGFIGRALAAALVEDGHAIDIVDNLSRGADDAALKALLGAGEVRFFNADLRAADAFDAYGDGYDYIVHLAALLGVQNVLDRPYATLRDNILLQEAALAFGLRQKALQRFVFTSTSEVYAGSLIHMDMPVPTPETFPLVVSELTEPRTSYMLSKIYGEALLIHSGLPYTIVRPHNVYGPRMGMSHVVPQLLKKAHKAAPGSTIEVFSVDHRRSFCFIDDAVAMLKAAIFSEQARNQVLNLGSQGPEIPMGQLAQVVIETVGKPLTIEARPPTPGSPERRAPMMTKMTQATGVAAGVGLAEGVARTYDWYRSHVFDR